MNAPRTDTEFPKLTWEDKQWVLESFAQQLESDLIKAEKQRDRLAEALEYCLNIIGPPDKDPEWWSDLDCDKAWQDGQEAIAAVKAKQQ